LIAPNLVLTAKHCVDKDEGLVRWTVNTHRRNISNANEGGISYNVLRVVQNPEFDAAVLVLGRPSSRGGFSPRPLAYNRREAVPALSRRARVLGWGEYGTGQGSEVSVEEVEVRQLLRPC
jgi:hypothetical protein